jgi:capsular exopolysaccharide synthesis family protein
MSDSIYAIALELGDAVKTNRLHSVTVTSARNGEGKTTVATALGRCLAKMPLRVLLIDFDLRHPSVERGLLAAAPNTLEPLRSQQIGKHEALEVRVDIQSGLHIMTPFPVGGCDDPLGYLRSTTLQQTIELASHSYDLLVFDTPPVMAVPDALSVARLSDVIVLVAELGRIDQTEAAELSRRLEGTHRQLIGVVVTKVDDDMQYYSSDNLP